jgi:uncharacterized protein YodC (DUF2158 family)
LAVGQFQCQYYRQGEQRLRFHESSSKTYEQDANRTIQRFGLSPHGIAG